MSAWTGPTRGTPPEAKEDDAKKEALPAIDAAVAARVLVAEDLVTLADEVEERRGLRLCLGSRAGGPGEGDSGAARGAPSAPRRGGAPGRP